MSPTAPKKNGLMLPRGLSPLEREAWTPPIPSGRQRWVECECWRRGRTIHTGRFYMGYEACGYCGHLIGSQAAA